MVDEHDNDSQTDAVGESPGEILRDARIRRGLSIEQTADELRLTGDAVRRLELNDFDTFKARIYVLGYLKSYARFVGVDQDLIARQFHEIYEETENTDRFELVSDDSDWLYRFLHRHMSSLLVGTFIAVLIVILSIVWYFWNDEQRPGMSGVDAQAEDPSQFTDSSDEVDKPFVLEPHGTDDGRETSDPEGAAGQTANEYVVAGDRGGDDGPTQQNGLPLLRVKSNLEFRFSEDCWIEATGNDKGEVFTRLAMADEVIVLMMTPPIQVKIGNARATKLTYKSKPVSFVGKTYSNVANLTLGQ